MSASHVLGYSRCSGHFGGKKLKTGKDFHVILFQGRNLAGLLAAVVHSFNSMQSIARLGLIIN